MPNDPQGRTADDGIRQVRPEEGPSGTAPVEVGEPGEKHNVTDADWLAMATADPALFIKDTE